MTTHADGSGDCDRCGKHLPNTGVFCCIIIAGMTQEMAPVTLHLCTTEPKPCAPHVLTKKALAQLDSPPIWYQEPVHAEQPSTDSSPA